jgi:Lysylphosphatidylglycerol synthase TM region/O-Antigen ligase
MTGIRALVSTVLLVGAIILVFSTADFASFLQQAGRVSLGTLILVAGAISASCILAAWRLQHIAYDAGHRLSFREAVASVSSGALGAALFFQIAGQLIARGALLSRHGVPFAATVVMTAYERGVAALVSAALAVIGATVIFGRIWLDLGAGGVHLVKLAIALGSVAATGAALAYGPVAAGAIGPLLTTSAALRFARSAGLTLAIQLLTMSAYVAVAKQLSPAVPLPELAAATAVVMFAASVPVSLAGWGIREMSAIAALGAIGIATSNALIVAVAVGTTSLLVMAGLALASVRAWISARPSVVDCDTQRISIDYGVALAWSAPLAAASLVLFQVYVPVASGKLSVNLADPIAILGGILFVLSCRQAPNWRLPWLNAALLITTAVLSLSLVIGAANFGWTAWAVVNKWLGWFVLLAYAATGALIVRRASAEGFRLLLLTFAAAATAVAAVDIVLVLANAMGLVSRGNIVEVRISGFSQNANAFAFQMLMALIAISVLDVGHRIRVVLTSVILAALWFSSSRAAWITLVIILGVGIWSSRLPARGIALGAGIAAGMAVFTWAAAGLLAGLGVPVDAPLQFSPATSSVERVESLIGGWRLFLDHPVFGGGLGAHVASKVATSGVPLVIHSTPLWLLAEAGLVGLLAFLVPAIATFASEWRRDDRAAHTIVLVLLAFGVMSTVHELLYQRPMWLVLGAALAVLPARRVGNDDWSPWPRRTGL